jgi:hypothetical protein
MILASPKEVPMARYFDFSSTVAAVTLPMQGI